MDAIEARWLTPVGRQLATEVWQRLRTGKGLDGLTVDVHEGRHDLRGLSIVGGVASKLRPWEKWLVEERSGSAELRGVRLLGLDLTGSSLPSLRVFGGAIQGCKFDRAELPDLRLWGVEVEDTSFRASNLSGSVLGGWLDGRGTRFRRVDFSRAKLAAIATPSATFDGCKFADVRLSNVEFDSDFFDCVFTGTLRDVYFYAFGAQPGKSYPNRLERVDFSGAEFRWVGFKGFDLDSVALPTGDDHLIVDAYPCSLREAAGRLRERGTELGLAALFEEALKWAGPHQARGVFNRKDLAEVSTTPLAGVQALEDAMRACGAGWIDPREGRRQRGRR